MIGNPKWFKRRAYTGWGITPKSWQGWAYILGLTALTLIASLITYLIGMNDKYRLITLVILLSIIIIDFVDIARKIKQDERESLHEAIAERNVAWFITLVLSIGIIYQSIISILHNSLYIDPFIITALIGGTIVKGFSNWNLSDK